MAKLTRSGNLRRKPGPKPHTATIQATIDPLGICLQAYDAAPDQNAAADAYRRAMPRMEQVTVADWANIVAQGMARRVLTGKEASTMLYAAQVARK